MLRKPVKIPGEVVGNEICWLLYLNYWILLILISFFYIYDYILKTYIGMNKSKIKNTLELLLYNEISL